MSLIHQVAGMIATCARPSLNPPTQLKSLTQLNTPHPGRDLGLRVSYMSRYVIRELCADFSGMDA